MGKIGCKRSVLVLFSVGKTGIQAGRDMVKYKNGDLYRIAIGRGTEGDGCLFRGSRGAMVLCS